jgi:hypothetical protein
MRRNSLTYNADTTRTIVVNFVHGQSQADDETSRGGDRPLSVQMDYCIRLRAGAVSQCGCYCVFNCLVLI